MNSPSNATPATSRCQTTSIACPLAVGCVVTSPFAPARKHPLTGVTQPHLGVDYWAPRGSIVVAANNGVIGRSYTSTSYGETIVLRHDNGSATLSAHLSNWSFGAGAVVLRNQEIGRSGSTGLSSGPHIHFEYVPSGALIQSKSRIDPNACIGAQLTGSITVRGNGNIADNAFEVFIDGVKVGATSIGGSNTLAVNNLLRGAHSITITAIVAPDNVGTYEIRLNDGLRFADGITIESEIITQFASVSFVFLVP